MKILISGFSLLLAGSLSAADFAHPDILDCLDTMHPSGLSLTKIKERSQFMFGDGDDLSIQVITYINLKKKLAQIISSSTNILDASQSQLINKIMSSAAALKIKICDGFGITPAQLLLLKEKEEEEVLPVLADAPSLDLCLDPASPCGLNLEVVFERERILRLHGIADDPATFIFLYRQTKLEMQRPENVNRRIALTHSLHELLKKIAASGLGLSYCQIFAIA